MIDGDVTSTIDHNNRVNMFLHGSMPQAGYELGAFTCPECSTVAIACCRTRRSCETLACSPVVVHFTECAAYHLLSVGRNFDIPMPTCKSYANVCGHVTDTETMLSLPSYTHCVTKTFGTVRQCEYEKHVILFRFGWFKLRFMIN